MGRVAIASLLFFAWAGVRVETAGKTAESNSYAAGLTTDARYKLMDNLDGGDTVAISGIIACGSQLLADVNMNGLGVMTDTNGFYIAAVSSGWSGTVTPVKYGYTFDPNNRSYTNITTDQTYQNYIAMPADDFNDSRRGGAWRPKR